MTKILLKIWLCASLAAGMLLLSQAYAQGVAEPAAASASASATASTSASIPVSDATPPAATPQAPAAAMTAPGLIDATKINTGDTAWMLTSTALVLLMTIPGLALFYAGMVRQKNVLATMAHSFVTVCIVTVLWVVVGYSVAFTPGSAYLGGLSRLMLDGMVFMKDAGKLSVSHLAPNIPESVFVMYQMTFAIITPALITGAFAERMKFSALILFVALWSLLVYAPIAHWVWEPGGWLAVRGVLDFAGGTVVHINAGISGLVAAIMVGRRIGYGREHMPPHNLGLTLTGASLLWVGWFGFNAGSALGADGRAGMAMLVTQVATAVGALAWIAVEWIRRGRPSVLGLATGAVAGLVAITPAAGFVDVQGALIIGAVAGSACYLASTMLKSWLGYDDSLDVFGVHAVGGICGALLTGVLAVKNIGGVIGSFETQAIGVFAALAYAALGTAIILYVLDKTIGLRVSEKAEHEGLDIEQHGEAVR